MSVPEQNNALQIVNFGGGSGGSVMAAGLVEAFSVRDLSVLLPQSDVPSSPDLFDGRITEVQVTNVTPVADGGSKTLEVRQIWGGPAVGDSRKVLGAVSSNAAGLLFRDTGGPQNTGGRFGAEATQGTVRDFNETVLGALATSGVSTERPAAILEDVIGLTKELPNGLRGHTYGNLVLTALRLDHGGDITLAVNEASRWLDAKARVLPVSAESHNLVMYDGAKNRIVYGEGAIDDYVVADPSRIKVWLESGSVKNFIEEDPRKVRELLEAGKFAPRPHATPEAVAAVANSRVAMAGPGSPITSLRPAMQPLGIAGSMAVQQERGGLWVAIANLDTEESTPDLTLEGYLGWLEEDVERPFSYVIHNDPTHELPEGSTRIQSDPERIKIRDAIAIGAVLVGVNATKNPNDPIAHLRAGRYHNTWNIADALQAHVLPEAMAAAA
ncbi:MAG TPA: 2-phospho-L-lactate transferase CofD family protein [Candidatus Saccharimonadales bacterium]|jgi:2-phospho-L-lactate transferase/gluconeogenesis factor (CofD/UPF0052 family)|nr:2-phospho-L-lactate transferase CofD family protein [Candidatus Saccharimonadales bacterium]